MPFVVLRLLLEVRQCPWAGRLPVWGASHVRLDRGLDLFGLPVVRLEVIAPQERL
jgi:hypothetical protein